MSRDCIYIIDTFSLMFQVFHAIPPMTGTQGQPTNAVFGFTRDIFAIRDRISFLTIGVIGLIVLVAT